MASAAEPKRKRALVTGARGFIGRRLVQELLGRSWEVVCFDHAPSRNDALTGLPVTRVVGDICNREAMRDAVERVSVIFHLAASTAPRTEAEAVAVNVEGTRCVAEAANAADDQPVLVYVSSLAAAGPGSTPAVESAACHPVSIYGRTKLAAEQVLKDYAPRLPITIVRPPCVFGRGDRNFWEMVQWVQRGWNFHSGRQHQYSFLHVDDLVAGLLLACEKGRRLGMAPDELNSGVYYLSDPIPVTFPELAESLAHELGVERVRHIRAPRSVAWLSAVSGEWLQRITGKRVYLNRDKVREAYAGSWVCDARRAESELAFAPAMSLAERIEQTLRDYRSDGWL